MGIKDSYEVLKTVCSYMESIGVNYHHSGKITSADKGVPITKSLSFRNISSSKAVYNLRGPGKKAPLLSLSKGGKKISSRPRIYANFVASFKKRRKEGFISLTKQPICNYFLIGFHPYSIISFYKIVYKTF